MNDWEINQLAVAHRDGIGFTDISPRTLPAGRAEVGMITKVNREIINWALLMVVTTSDSFGVHCLKQQRRALDGFRRRA